MQRQKASAKIHVVTGRRWSYRLVPGLSLHTPESGPESRNKWLMFHVLRATESDRRQGLQLGMGFVLSLLHGHDECFSESGLRRLLRRFGGVNRTSPLAGA